jgi:hypothetical protein
LPIKTILDAELHEGGSKSFTLDFLLMMSHARAPKCRIRPSLRYLMC